MAWKPDITLLVVGAIMGVALYSVTAYGWPLIQPYLVGEMGNVEASA